MVGMKYQCITNANYGSSIGHLLKDDIKVLKNRSGRRGRTHPSSGSVVVAISKRGGFSYPLWKYSLSQ
jgi:hypothetical protein